MADEMVNVRIEASQKVRYRQVVRMKRSEWEALKRTPERKIGDVAAGHLDFSNIFDADGIEPFDVGFDVVDESGKRVMPVDEYTGG